MGVMFWLIFKEQITYGEFMALLFYSFRVINGMTMFGEVVKTYQEAKASIGVLDDIMQMEPAPVPSHPRDVHMINSLSFDKVSFGYSNEKPVLHNVSREVNAGKTVAFVGPSGSGKSTIIKLMCGLYPAT